MKTSKDKKIKEMTQYWIETAEKDAIIHYAQYKMEQWYYNQTESQVDDFYSTHIKQLAEESKE